MTKDPACVTAGDSIRKAVELMRTRDVGLIPVVENDNSRKLLGVITDRDIALRVVGEGLPADGNVQQFMSNGVHTARPDDEVDSVMNLMGREQIRRIPIVDERGSVVGIVAQADVVLEGGNAKKVDNTIEKISRKS
ncbi:MAG TPA: CBS domain-containing protein [Gemmatimonadales bacterium]|nr:CBS domain-containing protein [Gemmatimonadales bacterium]